MKKLEKENNNEFNNEFNNCNNSLNKFEENDMNDVTIVILIAGNATRMLPLSLGMPKCMFSVMQKPAIFNMLIPFINRGLSHIVFVVNKGNKNIVKGFMDRAFGNLNLTIDYVIQDVQSGPLDAFCMARDYLDKEKTLLLLGDTICDSDFSVEEDFIASYKVEKNTKHMWCMITKDSDNNLINLIDKPKEEIETDDAVIGLYLFNDTKLLKKLMEKHFEIIKGERQLSSIILAYNKERKIKVMPVRKWYDVGTLENYERCNLALVNSRYFNNFDTSRLGLIEKKSTFSGIINEMNWYKKMSETDIKRFIPQIYNYDYDNSSYTIEYIDMSNLSEYYLYYNIPADNYSFIFGKILDIANEINKCLPDDKDALRSSEDIKENTRKMYIEKTLKRIEKWDRSDLISANKIFLNGKEVVSFTKAFEILSKRLAKIICDSDKNYGVIHGDLNFSNILYSPRTSIFKLIDPRGEFGAISVFGDIRYDYAKLRHSYHGKYEMIINDLFDIDCEKLDDGNTFNITFKTFIKEEDTKEQIDAMDKVMIERGIDLDDVELIEALLFISMIALHEDKPKRQLAFYAIGLLCLNNQIEKL